MSFLSDNFISEFLVTVLRWIYNLVGDYSVAIIITILIIRLILLPFDLKQRRSSRVMARLAPEADSIKKRYANNPEQANKKVQELYKANGASPMAGCIPMLIQLPLLFAFFGALRVIATEETISIVLNAVENGAESVVLPNWLWVHNMWQPDSGLASVVPSAQEFMTFMRTNSTYITPQTLALMQSHDLISFAGTEMTVNAPVYTALMDKIVAANNLTGYANGWFGLPIIAGATLFLQQKMTSKHQPQQPETAGMNKMMLYFFPIFSVYICCTSNAAFSIYWVVSNIYSMAVQIITTAYYNKKEGPLPTADTGKKAKANES